MMKLQPHSLIHRVGGLPGHLNDLAEHFRSLSTRVRESITESLGETLGRTVKDVLNRCWSGQRLLQEYARPFNRPTQPYDWSNDPDDRLWNDVPPWEEPTLRPRSPLPTTTDTTRTALAAVGLQVAGWWLHRHGTWLGAMGVGFLVGGVALVGGRIAIIGLGLAESIHEILTLHQVLASGADKVDRQLS